MPPSARQELLTIQKKLWKRNRALIDASILVKEPGFDRYEANYRRAVRSYQERSDQKEMVRAVLKADIIYVGDYHTCNQSQRSFLRILKAVSKKTKNFSVGLELIHKRHQDLLTKYMNGKISRETFLKRIKLKEHWIYDLWDNFKPLFDFCEYHHIPMHAIEAAPPNSSLLKRDEATAKLLAKIVQDNPEKKLFVFIGDLHIAPQHLPHFVSRELKKKKIKAKTLTLFENSEPIYWKLAEKGLDDATEVVRINEGSFCRMHTPPLVCQRSYLNWLEHEEGEIDYADARHEFLELVDRICEFLRMDLGKEREHVEIFTSGDLSFIKRLREDKRFTKKELNHIKQQILASESYYIAKAKFVYLSNLSVNHAAEEASHFIKHSLSGTEEPRDLVDAFYANILHEALGFFGSKLINHKRKCNHLSRFKALVSFLEADGVPADRELEYEMACLVVEYKRFEKKKKPLQCAEVFRAHMDLFVAVTHALGYMLGDFMYYGLMSRKISRKAVRELFEDPWREEGRPFEVYMDLIKKLKDVKIPKRM